MLIKDYIAKQEKLKEELINSFKIGDKLRAICNTFMEVKCSNSVNICKGEVCIIIDIDRNTCDFPLRVKFYIDNEEIVTDLSFEELEGFERVLK